MDFEELWGRHRNFLLLAAAGLLVLLVAQGVRGALYGQPTRRLAVRARALQRDLRRLPRVAPRQVRELRRETEALATRLERLRETLQLEVPQRFRLPAVGGKAHYAQVVQTTREDVAEVAAGRNVAVPWSLGLPPVTPASRDEMDQYLRGLYVVERLVTAALEAGVRRVELLEVKPAPPGEFLREVRVRMQVLGDGPAFFRLLDRLLDPEDPLPVTGCRVAPPPRGRGLVATLTVSLCDVDLTKPLAEGDG